MRPIDIMEVEGMLQPLEQKITEIENTLPPDPGSIQFTSGSRVWTVPARVKKVTVEMVGAGGGGGMTPELWDYFSYITSGAGGGAGAYYKGEFIVTPGENITITIGAGGVGGASNNTLGGTGGVTSFGSKKSVSGGAGGRYGVWSQATESVTGGAGGTTTGGTNGDKGQDGIKITKTGTTFPASGAIGGTNSAMTALGLSTYGRGGSAGLCYMSTNGNGSKNTPGNSGSNGWIRISWG